MQQHLLGVALRLIVAAIAASYPLVVSKALARGMDVPDILVTRFGPGALIALAIILFAGVYKSLETLRIGLFLGVVHGILMAALSSTGLRFAPPEDASLLGPPTVGAWAYLILLLFFGEKLPGRVLFAILLLFAGIAILLATNGASSSFGVRRLLGDALFLAAGAAGGAASVAVRRSAKTPFHLSMVSAFIAGVGSLGLTFALQGTNFAQRLELGDAATSLVYFGLAMSLAVPYLVYKSIKLAGAGASGMVDAAIPVIGTLLAVSYSGRILNSLSILSLTLIVTGIVMANFYTLRKETRGPAIQRALVMQPRRESL